MRRRLLVVILIAAILSPVILVASFVPIPLLVLEPGPAPDVAERSRIEATTYPSKGSMHLTTAQVRSPGGATTAEVILGLLSSDKHVVPRESVYPSDQSDQDTESVQMAQMAQSGSAAAAAALNELGMPYVADGVFVNEVESGDPASQRLVAGDIITSLNRVPVVSVVDLTEALEAVDAGGTVRLRVMRGSDENMLTVKTVESSDEPGKAELGIKVSQSHRAPVRVDISAQEIGGPSAGLMFALSIYDRLVPEDLTGGKVIAGTGTIENSGSTSGKVGEVGAVELKVAGAQKIGADVFIVPKLEAPEAEAAAYPGLEVIGVSTLAEAISALEMLLEDD